MRFPHQLEGLLLQQQKNIAYFEIIDSDYPFVLQKYKKYTLISNLNTLQFQKDSLFHRLLAICFDLGFNVYSTLPYEVLNITKLSIPPIRSIGQLEDCIRYNELNIKMAHYHDRVSLSVDDFQMINI